VYVPDKGLKKKQTGTQGKKKIGKNGVGGIPTGGQTSENQKNGKTPQTVDKDSQKDTEEEHTLGRAVLPCIKSAGWGDAKKKLHGKTRGQVQG